MRGARSGIPRRLLSLLLRHQSNDPELFDFDDSLTRKQVERLAATDNLQVVQTNTSVKARTWQLLNDHLLPARPDVELRVYGPYGLRCDLRFVEHIPNVRRFSADCLRDADHFEAIAKLPRLERLSVGVYGAQSFEFLHDVTAGLGSLTLGATRSKKPDLAALERFKGLTTLYLEGRARTSRSSHAYGSSRTSRCGRSRHRTSVT